MAREREIERERERDRERERERERERCSGGKFCQIYCEPMSYSQGPF